MKISALLPIRHDSERIPGKNRKLLNGVPLYHHIIYTLLESPSIKNIFVDSDSQSIKKDLELNFPSVHFLQRPKNLSDGHVSMNEVLANTLNEVESELFFQTHATNPFLKSETIENALRYFIKSQNTHDSAFSVVSMFERLWSLDNTPINHNPLKLERTQDLTPIFRESSTFYIFSKTSFAKRINRIGTTPLLIQIPELEAFDIDFAWQWEIASAIMRK